MASRCLVSAGVRPVLPRGRVAVVSEPVEKRTRFERRFEGVREGTSAGFTGEIASAARRLARRGAGVIESSIGAIGL